jgi:hypothetical protein
MRTELEERGGTLLQHLGDSLREEHRLAQIANPVRRVERVARKDAALDCRIHLRRPSRRTHAAHRGEELVEQRIHVRTMRRHVHLHPPAEHAIALEIGQQRAERLRLAGDQRRGRTVERDDPQAFAAPGQGRRRLIGRQADHRQRTLAGGRRQQAAPMADHLDRIGQVEHAGHVRRRDLSHAVADHRVGLHAP